MRRFAMQKRTRTALALALAFTGLAACSGGGSSGSSPASPPISPSPSPLPPPPVSETVTISGTITFDRVPFGPGISDGLDYDSISQDPARGVVVEAIDATGTLLASDVTSSAGVYSVTVDADTNVRIQARAQLLQSGAPSWDIEVFDNTSSFAPYLLQGNFASSGSTNSTRNLNAPSGWNGSTLVDSNRAAGPFAILDSIYTAVDTFVAVDPDVSFPALQIYWSVDNVPGGDKLEAGGVPTSFYSRFASQSSVSGNVPTIVILGAKNNDTDEYDQSVVIHEFGHYTEDNLFRYDTTGGPHSLSDRLDMRLAFSEGWGNSFASMMLNDPIYRDSGGFNQSSLQVSFSNEANDLVPSFQGWFNEISVGSILYDIFDSNSDSGDLISAGFGPIYTAFSSPDVRQSGSPMSIFLFIDSLRKNSNISDAALTDLLNAQSIFGSGPDGAGETNSGGISETLPPVKPIAIGGPAVEVCSFNDEGSLNKHGNRALLQFSNPSTQTLTVTMTRTSGASVTDPDFDIYREGSQTVQANGTVENSETRTQDFQAGGYFIDAYAAENVSGNSGLDACFDIQITN